MESQPLRLRALLEGLAAAAAWADDAANRRELAALLARPEYLNVSAGLIEESLNGRLLGGGVQASDPDFMYFHRHDANRPRPEDALWAYAQMVRWGQLRPSADQQRRAARVFRDDLYSRYLDFPDSPKAAPVLPFDGIEFTAGEINAYLAQFSIATGFVESSAGLQS
jgi:NitT/TauT family transport system ATP-binding protein